MVNIGKAILCLRKEKHISQGELAKHLNVTRQAISNWERNKSEPDAEIIKNIADYFEVEIDYLFSNEKALKSYNTKINKILFLVNIFILSLHILFATLGQIYAMPVFITPMLITFFIMIIHIVFFNSIKTNDYSIIAGYDKNKDDTLLVKKQLFYIELLVEIIGLICNSTFFLVYSVNTDNIMAVSLIISGAFLLNTIITILTVNIKISTRHKK